MIGSGMNLITTVIGFGMSATFIVFVCARLICGRLRRVDSRQMFEIESRIDLEQPEHQNTGLEPVVVASIPTMKFNHEAFSSMEDAQSVSVFASMLLRLALIVRGLPIICFFFFLLFCGCTICLGEYQEKEVLRIMPQCGHNFHLSCIDVWLRKQSTCPVCRLPLQDSFETKHARLAPLAMPQPVDRPEILINHSRQWHNESASGNQPGEAEIR